jgi:hypothetical protein
MKPQINIYLLKFIKKSMNPLSQNIQITTKTFELVNTARDNETGAKSSYYSYPTEFVSEVNNEN